MTLETFPGLLRTLRLARRLSQEELSRRARVSPRHLSCIETGRSSPSREMVLRLAATLDLPLRDRNRVLISAGFAPTYPDTGLDDAALTAVRRAIDLIFEKQEPYGALTIDRGWNVTRTNHGAALLLGCFSPSRDTDLRIAGNLVRSVLHPDGIRRAVVNWREVAQVTLERLTRECAQFPFDETRASLLDEVMAYPDVGRCRVQLTTPTSPFVSIHLRSGRHEAKIFAMLSSLGTAMDVGLQELTIETYFPADEATDRWWRELAAAPTSRPSR